MPANLRFSRTASRGSGGGPSRHVRACRRSFGARRPQLFPAVEPRSRFCVAFRDSRSNRRDCARRKIFARLCSIALIASIGASKIDGSTLLFVGVRLLRSSTFRRNLRSPQPSRSPRFCWLSCRSRPSRTDSTMVVALIFFIRPFRPFLFFLGAEPCSSASRRAPRILVRRGHRIKNI